MSKANLLDRRAVVAELLKDRKGAFAVGGLGASTYDIAAAGDHDRNFYLWGGMGGAVMIGLGLALAQPTLPVVVITGDGEMLMGMGSLATVGLQQPKNLSIIVLDNEAYGETGGQASHTGGTADLVGVAKACGIGDSRAISTMAEVEAFASSLQDVTAGPRFASAKIDGANLERVLSSRDGTYLVNRIRGSIGHTPI
ncbi:thiamine pyrophosphate-dependent acetolactate synthase large subunit-like protein [Bradyrhizobium japonicum]|jgi:thiamine pyrophosphate-dependent acetolactate synthase large subunit-like protein|uniref:Thiamine pyrophosphate-dependent acetolactate synthase large subunit-like protein n=1 Tax=Bradyrhizobium elkanii TaxID=29448 RepID=A0A4Q4K6R7_BRAEL|nr:MULTISPECIES: thiamine pyrophosphate-dependent enzyme [Bradyrhizobium]MBP1299085.1 thiamine pyrophosphate-dependent acetolactate synthase large subunit-like protein [Bradyrhizobium elkanii]MBR1163000.1 aldehyde dehydrogenase [Bradyrhizobium elkanii]MCP1729602.1 thiamine pyrophosphate-dependent acetolactate synthase large subunit-like protein [Bradyrhizobium elkanii]MCP1756341.1 thiamine pyrophosphate-dependent acetolactate synthase large subunit-like protein [Bradyrhizobium elkanii]MCP19300